MEGNEKKIMVSRGLTRLMISEEFEGKVRKTYVVSECEELLFTAPGENGYDGIWGALDSEYQLVRFNRTKQHDRMVCCETQSKPLSVGEALSWKRDHFVGGVLVITLHINVASNEYSVDIHGYDRKITEDDAKKVTKRFGTSLTDIQKNIRWMAAVEV